MTKNGVKLISVALWWATLGRARGLAATAVVLQVDDLEGRVADGRPDLELEVRRGSGAITADQVRVRVVGGGGVETPAVVVPPPASLLGRTVACSKTKRMIWLCLLYVNGK